MDERKESRRTRERKIISSRRSGNEDFLEQRARAVAQAGAGGGAGGEKHFLFLTNILHYSQNMNVSVSV